LKYADWNAAWPGYEDWQMGVGRVELQLTSREQQKRLERGQVHKVRVAIPAFEVLS
jgi:hypothetical protein